MAIAILSSLGIYGCGMPGLVWKEASITGSSQEGALNVGNTRPPLQSQCGTTGWMENSPTCNYAFIDSTGRRVNIEYLRRELDKLAEQLPQLHPWITNTDSHRDARLPYTFFLLTISPAVVLVVPNQTGEPYRWPCGTEPPAKAGCLPSQSFRSNAYWYRESPPVSEGTFWFSPSSPGNTFSIDANSPEVTITVGEATLRFVSSNGKWTVSRER